MPLITVYACLGIYFFAMSNLALHGVYAIYARWRINRNTDSYTRHIEQLWKEAPMSGNLRLREERDYDSATGATRSRWQVLLDDYPITPIEDHDEVQRHLRDLIQEATQLAEMLEATHA